MSKGQSVRVIKLLPIVDKQIDPLLLRNRRKNREGVIDSPLYLTYNKLWLVKHNQIKHYRGIPIYSYAVYQLDELEFIEGICQPLFETGTNILTKSPNPDSDDLDEKDWLGYY